MSFKVIAVDFHHAPLDVRGKVALASRSEVESLVGGLDEKVWLSTCNRVELYYVGSDSPQDLIDRWASLAQISGDVRSFFQIHSDEAAFRHLFRVASSLESMVVGEAQISGQVKKAYEESVETNWVGVHLHRLFQRAFRVAKKVRTQTEVGRLAVSIPSLGVKLSEKVLGDLTERRVGVIGLGEMGRLSAEHFASVQPKEVWLYNRTHETAQALCAELSAQGGIVKTITDPIKIISEANVIVMAADADLVSEENLRVRDAEGSPFFVLDLTVPARVPRIELDQGYIYGVDDLKTLAEQNQGLRRQELVKAEEIIEDEIRSLIRSGENRTIKDAIRELSAKTGQITEAELRYLRSKLPHVADSDWKEIELMARRLSAKVVQDPMVELKSMSKESGEAEGILHLFRSLFKI